MTRQAILRLVTTAAVVLAATVGVVIAQYRHLGAGYINADQLARHLEVLAGRAGDPWQYRPLSEWIVAGGRWVLEPFVRTSAPAFLVVRGIQNIAVFALAVAYYRRLGLGTVRSLLAIALVAWAMAHAMYDSNLSFNVYSEVGFYLAGGLLVLVGREWWVVPLTALAIVNRESAMLLPAVIPAFAATRIGWTRSLRISAAAVAAGVGAYFAVRWAYGPQQLLRPYGIHQGFDLFAHNMRPVTAHELMWTFGITPLLAMVGWRRCHRGLRLLAATMLPIWVVVHFIAAVAGETRLFLVPIALVLAPMAASVGLRRGVRPP